MPHEARIETIEGQPTLVVDRRPPLPQKMPDLLGQLRSVTYTDDFPLGGMSVACQLRDHPFRRFREGRHLGTDGVLRDVALRMCSDCGAVEVRDVGYDFSIDGEDVPRNGAAPRRRSALLGWYSGARRNGREYR